MATSDPLRKTEMKERVSFFMSSWSNFLGIDICPAQLNAPEKYNNLSSIMYLEIRNNGK